MDQIVHQLNDPLPYAAPMSKLLHLIADRVEDIEEQNASVHYLRIHYDRNGIPKIDYSFRVDE